MNITNITHSDSIEITWSPVSTPATAVAADIFILAHHALVPAMWGIKGQDLGAAEAGKSYPWEFWEPEYQDLCRLPDQDLLSAKACKLCAT